MRNKESDSLIISLIINNNQFNITVIENLKCLITIPFNDSRYTEIKELIKREDWKSFKKHILLYDYADKFSLSIYLKAIMLRMLPRFILNWIGE